LESSGKFEFFGLEKFAIWKFFKALQFFRLEKFVIWKFFKCLEFWRDFIAKKLSGLEVLSDEKTPAKSYP
jgi:hypothetical protein